MEKILSFPAMSIVEKINTISKSLSTLACTLSMWELQIYIRIGNRIFQSTIKSKFFSHIGDKMPCLRQQKQKHSRTVVLRV